jgi:ubiquinone/menaquinone biosynthesis C-methylase UbiE
MLDSISLQRDYYRQTADQYDDMHGANPEHEFALAFMMSAIRFFGVGSVLDIGSGTGRVPLAIQSVDPTIRVVGIEPSPELRLRGNAKGANQIIDGDAQSLKFRDAEFDLVCSFGVLHHIPAPTIAVREMFRVARIGLFISDHNDYARGTRTTTAIKQLIKAAGLWPLYNVITTRGRGYRATDDDGIWYNYSIFETYRELAARCQRIHLMNTLPAGPNLYRSASHIALLALKDDYCAA